MKIALFMSALLLSFNVFAGVTQDSTWKEIKSNYNVVIDAPNISFNLRYISVVKLCVEEDQLRTAKKVTIEKRIPGNGDKGDTWEPIGKDYLYTPIYHKTYHCVDKGGDNCELKEVWQNHKTFYEIAVREYPTGDKTFGRTLFHKGYDIPSCPK